MESSDMGKLLTPYNDFKYFLLLYTITTEDNSFNWFYCVLIFISAIKSIHELAVISLNIITIAKTFILGSWNKRLILQTITVVNLLFYINI